MYLAPTWRAIATAIMPMGPAPVINTSSPTRSNASAVCTAFPSGSRMHAMSSETSSGIGCTFDAGNDDVLGKGTGPIDADADGPDAQVAATGLAVAASAADDVALAGHPLPDLDPFDLGANSRRRRRRIRARSPSAPESSSCAHSSHATMWRSVPQIEVLRTSIRTSLGPTSGSGMSCIQIPGSGLALTRARIRRPPPSPAPPW